MDGLDAMLENGPCFIWNSPLILKKWHPDEYPLKEDVSTILVWVKLHGVLVTAFSEDSLSAIATKLGAPLMLDSYTSNMCMQSWGRSSYARVMIELRADLKLKDNIVMAMPKIKGEGHYICAGKKKTLMKPSQTSRGIPVGLEIGFKPRQEYRHVPKKTTASSSGNKNKGEKPTCEVSNSNPFEVLNSIDNDEELVYPSDHDSEDEVTSVDNDMARDLAFERTGFGNQSLLEQWRDSYVNGDYNEDPYDDDMYEGHDLSEEI
nr:hypothetical protein [Tanacetum cinerariifolium]GFA05200.1 hypothetical protein [Tanacetum cinerariifolium]